jgi:uncharacterized membrane protein YfcA
LADAYKGGRDAWLQIELIRKMSGLMFQLEKQAVYGTATRTGGSALASAAGFAGLANIQQANGLKNLGSGTGNAIAALIFVFSGLVVWQVAISVAIGSIIGGLLGGRLAQKLDASYFRIIILLVAIIASIYLFIKNS